MAAAVQGEAASGTYRPHLDGLRAVAVYLVVAFHAGSQKLVGGFIGVDVFFVLSGFLVTQLLLRDLVPSGSLRFRRFYSRRFRRLLPAAFVVLVITAIVFAAVASPLEVAHSIGGFKAAFLYSANWYFISQSSQYFGPDVQSNPVVHFWSLAVEEQFYLVWPLLLAGLFALVRRIGAQRDRVLRAIVATGAVASLWWALSLRTTEPNRAYYGTDARAYQLLAGALLALSPELVQSLRRFPRAGRVAAVAAIAAVVLLATSRVHVDAIERGIGVTVLTMALIVALEVADGGVVQRGLSTQPVVYLGKVSYGTYLWHWPVILVIARSFEISTFATFVFTVLVATALASLSFQLMEHPIRVSPLLDRYRTPVIATGLAVSVISAVVLIPAIFDRSTSTPTAAAESEALATTGFTPVPNLDFAAIDSDVPGMPGCYGKPASSCTVVHGTGAHVLVIGDSHAGMIVPAFEVLAKQANLTLSVSVVAACPWQQGLIIPAHSFNVTPARCIRERADTYGRVIDDLDPDVVVVMNRRYEVDDSGPKYEGEDEVAITPGTPEFDALLTDATTRSVERLRADGRKVVILEPTPVTSTFDPLGCLTEADVLEECRSVVSTRPTNLELLYRQLDEGDDQVWSLDLDRLVCPYLPICDPIVDGMVVRKDGSHITRTYSRSLGPAILAALTSNGVLAPADTP